jgi:hypothetical protein
MAIVHAAFRRELAGATRLIESVDVGDTQRSGTVGRHVVFFADALHHHHAAEDVVIWPKLYARAPTREGDILFKHPRLGLVLAGFVLDGVSAENKRRFPANVPPPQRLAF